MTEFSVAGLTSIINQLLPEPHAGLLAGLLFGTKASLSRELHDALVRSGTLHIIALSGMNISIIMDLFAKGLLWVVSKRIASLLTILGIIWFVWFVGPSPSVIRAAIMGSLTLIAIIFGRQYWAMLSWALAVGIMLLLNFSWLFDLSFQLSALATLGIILFGRHSGDAEVGRSLLRARQASLHTGPLSILEGRGEPTQNAPPPRAASITIKQYNNITISRESTSKVIVREIIKVVWNISKENLHLTLAAQVFTIPLILWHFHRISLVSPLANIAIGWLIAPLTMMGWVTAVAGWVYLPLGQMAAWFDWVLLEYLVRIVLWTGNMPFASWGG